MRNKNTDLWKPRNPITHRTHRREVLWQITVPVVVGTVIILAACFLTAGLSSPLASRWADISIIWLIPPMFIFTFLFMVINGATIYLLIRLIDAAPGFFYKTQNLIRRVQLKVGEVDDKIVEPFMRAHGWSASVRAAKREAQRMIKRI